MGDVVPSARHKQSNPRAQRAKVLKGQATSANANSRVGIPSVLAGQAASHACDSLGGKRDPDRESPVFEVELPVIPLLLEKLRQGTKGRSC